MDYVKKLKEAQDTGGAKAVCGTVLLVMQGISSDNGRFNRQKLAGTLENDGNSGLLAAFEFCEMLMANTIYYSMRDRSDTPLKQIRWLTELCKMHKDYHSKTTPEFVFMLDAVAYAMNENIKDFLEVIDKKVSKFGSESVGSKHQDKIHKLAQYLIEFQIEGEHVEQLKRRAMIAKLAK